MKLKASRYEARQTVKYYMLYVHGFIYQNTSPMLEIVYEFSNPTGL